MSRPVLAAGVLLALLLAGCAGSPGTAPPSPATSAAACASPPPTPSVPAPTSPSVHGQVHAVLNTSMGDIRLLLFGDQLPMTVSSWVNLAKAGYFDCVRFHRVIGPAKEPPAGFMDQTGDPTSKDASKKDAWGTGGPGYTLPDEFACSDGNTSSTWTGAGGDPCSGHDGLKYRFDKAGMVAMANTGRPQSGGSQFFITMAPASFLDGGYPLFGQTEDDASTNVVKSIGNVATDGNDRPVQDVFILHASVVG